MIIGYILLQLIFGSYNNNDKTTEYYYKSDESYILREVVFGYDYTPSYATVSLYTEGGIFYLAEQKDLVVFLKEDSLNTKSLTMIIEPNGKWGLYNANKDQVKYHLSYSFGLEQLLTIDDTEIYKIGNVYYAIRKIKYMYCDEIDLYNTKYPMRYYETQKGKLYVCDNKQDSLDLSNYISFRDYYEGRDFRFFICLNELLPTDKIISKYVWKRKYELPLFWTEKSIKIMPCEKCGRIKKRE